MTTEAVEAAIPAKLGLIPTFFDPETGKRRSILSTEWDSMRTYRRPKKPRSNLFGLPNLPDRLLKRVHEWVDCGMPSLAAMQLRIFPAESPPAISDGNWLVQRNGSAFVWSIKSAMDLEN